MDIFALLQLGKQPVRLGVTNTKVDWLNPPWHGMQRDLVHKLDRPVHFEFLYPFQVRFGMAIGRLDFAMVSAGDYVAEFAEGDLVDVLAIPVSASHGNRKRGVLLAASRSDIKSIQDLKGKRFAFGPHGDSILHLAAVGALDKAGVKLSDLHRELVPVPGAFQHHISGIEAAKAAVYEEGTYACVVEEAEYNGWPETGGTLLPLKIAKDQVRVLGYTPYMPEGVILANKKADPQLVAAVKDYLLNGTKEKPEVLAALGWSGFEPAGREKLEPALRMGALAMQAEPKVPEDDSLPKADEDLNLAPEQNK